MMKAVLLLLVSVVCIQAMLGDRDMVRFKQFMNKYNKKYTPTEFGTRFAIFQKNLQEINRLNAKAASKAGNLKFAVNKFADLSAEEFTAYKGFVKHPKIAAPVFVDKGNVELPTSLDWRTKGAVTPVKDQGQCGSCWAFSATEGVESAWFLAGNTIPVLSEQQIVDCDTVDQGCDGGDLPTAFQYIVSAGGLESESDYPYQAQDGSCNFDASDIVAKISGFQYATQSTNETEMQVAMVANGPLSICVDAETWQFYSGGIITSDCANSLDHCVQAVGFDTDPTGIPYWIVRNSWGTDWGMNGYLEVERNQDLCGIADEATYVTIGSK